MIKWIGQHIWDFISRFRNDVYLESVADPGSDTDKFLVIDANNKVGYRTGTEVLSDIGASSESTDLEFNGSTANGILTYGGAAQIDVEALFTYTPDDLVMTGTGSGKPTFSMVNANADAEAPSVTLTKQSAGNSSNGDDIGEITFSAYNSNNEVTVFAKILAEIESVTDTDEAGKLSLLVQAYDGTWNNSLPAHQGRNAFTAIGHGTNDIVSTTIGYGAASTTTIAGNLNANGEDHAFTSATNSKPSVTISSGGTSQGGGHINFKRTATGANNQNLGDIYFIGNNDADEEIYYAYINGDIQNSSDGSEEGALYLGVASHDGELKTGLIIVSGNIEDEVDVTVGNGASSLVTVPGKLSIGARIDFDSTGITGIQTAAESFSDDDVSLMTSAAIDDRINAAGGGADEVVSTGDHILKQTKVTIDTAGFNGLNSTPVELVAAQGANKVIVPTEVVLFHDRAATNTVGTDLIVGFNGTTNYTLAVKYIRRYMQNVTTDRTMQMLPYSGLFANDLTTAVNSNLTIALGGTPTTNCVTSLTVYTSYYVIDIS